MTDTANEDRRPLKVRTSLWSQRFASVLAARGITPNQISVASVAFAAAGAGAMLAGGYTLIIAAVCVQARLLCNLFDGMVAVEHGKASVLGAVYNEFPDRIADSLLLVAAGYAAGTPAWGWFAALAAALTAYVRTFGASCGLGHDFRGPMAKQHRMFVLTLACVLAAVPAVGAGALVVAVAVIAVLSVVTCVTRTRALCAALEAKASQ